MPTQVDLPRSCRLRRPAAHAPGSPSRSPALAASGAGPLRPRARPLDLPL
jgi:hypothetical protein